MVSLIPLHIIGFKLSKNENFRLKLQISLRLKLKERYVYPDLPYCYFAIMSMCSYDNLIKRSSCRYLIIIELKQ